MKHDIIIIGGGPAGLTAAIYAARYNLNTIVLAKDLGQISKTPLIENYPGIDGIGGIELVTKMRKQVTTLKVPIKTGTAGKLEKTRNSFKITTREGEKYEAKTVILALGAHPKLLNIDGEDTYSGKGISYCTTCDAPIFRDKTVAVIGGSNSAATSALHVSDFAKKVTIIYRGKELRAQPILVDKIKKKKNIEIITKANVAELKGDKMLTGVKLDNGQEIKLDGVFIEIGYLPSNELARQAGADTDKKGYVKVDKSQMTTVPGLFAAGDLTDANNNLKQIVIAAAQGAVAANAIYSYLNHGSSQSDSEGQHW